MHILLPIFPGVHLSDFDKQACEETYPISVRTKYLEQIRNNGVGQGDALLNTACQEQWQRVEGEKNAALDTYLCTTAIRPNLRYLLEAEGRRDTDNWQWHKALLHPRKRVLKQTSM
jgi:hypothetical protein